MYGMIQALGGFNISFSFENLTLYRFFNLYLAEMKYLFALKKRIDLCPILLTSDSQGEEGV